MYEYVCVYQKASALHCTHADIQHSHLHIHTQAEAPSFLVAEERGMKELKHAGFVLVAGGLGERLG